MILFSDTAPPPMSDDLATLYPRLPGEGMVHSSIMCGQQYELADAFDPAWSCAAVAWSAGGRETYRFAKGPTISIGPAGALSLASGVRYAYSASKAHRFRSSMIVFPRWIVDEYGSSALDVYTVGHNGGLKTRRFHPDHRTLSSMNQVAALCRIGERNDAVYEERLVLLYAQLMMAQSLTDTACLRLPTTRHTTRMELGRRVNRARDYILENYCDDRLSLHKIAQHACLSKFHLIRTYRACTGCTPMQFVTRVRIDSAYQLLCNTSLPITEIASTVGYQDRAAFFRAFRKRYGVAPSTVRMSR